jgi:hypothetical protein
MRPYPKQMSGEKTKTELLQKHGKTHVTKTDDTWFDSNDLAEEAKKSA